MIKESGKYILGEAFIILYKVVLINNQKLIGFSELYDSKLKYYIK